MWEGIWRIGKRRGNSKSSKGVEENEGYEGEEEEDKVWQSNLVFQNTQVPQFLLFFVVQQKYECLKRPSYNMSNMKRKLFHYGVTVLVEQKVNFCSTSTVTPW